MLEHIQSVLGIGRINYYLNLNYYPNLNTVKYIITRVDLYRNIGEYVKEAIVT
jgi:hypothetical protein